MPRFAYEDFLVGQVLEQEPIAVDKDEMVAFAHRFDPQPFHLSEEGAKGTFTERLVAPGWFSCSLFTKYFVRRYLVDSSICGGAGMRELRWLKPVYPGDKLRSIGTVLEKRVSRSKPGFGLITFENKLINQDNDVAMSNVTTVMLGLRGVAIIPSIIKREPIPGWEPPTPDDPLPLPFIEDVPVGLKYVLGSHLFTAEDIKSYASVYDPQPFHTDEIAAKNTFFGGLCASGIQTAALWATFSAIYNAKSIEYASQKGGAPPRFGVSPGFKDLKWLIPVYAGDTITYRTEVLGHRRTRTDPKWGLLVLKATGENQYGDKVLEYRSSVILESKPV